MDCLNCENRSLVVRSVQRDISMFNVAPCAMMITMVCKVASLLGLPTLTSTTTISLTTCLSDTRTSIGADHLATSVESKIMLENCAEVSQTLSHV
jgi:hypothetical protein